MKISVVTPAFNEEKNLPLLAEELLPVLEQSAMDWEWLIFDDHSEDNTFSVATQMAQKNPRIRCARMAKNYGSHALALFGFQQHKATVPCYLSPICKTRRPPLQR